VKVDIQFDHFAAELGGNSQDVGAVGRADCLCPSAREEKKVRSHSLILPVAVLPVGENALFCRRARSRERALPRVARDRLTHWVESVNHSPSRRFTFS
jgi:hypothetical protein